MNGGMIRDRAFTVLGYLGGFALLFLVWHLAATWLARSALFPPPWPVFERAVVLVQEGFLQDAVLASLRRIAQGFLIGSAVGIPIDRLNHQGVTRGHAMKPTRREYPVR